MYGDGIGSLTVYRKLNGSVTTDQLWRKTGSQDNIWRMGRANLDRTNKLDSYVIYFEGTRGKSIRGFEN